VDDLKIRVTVPAIAITDENVQHLRATMSELKKLYTRIIPQVIPRANVDVKQDIHHIIVANIVDKLSTITLSYNALFTNFLNIFSSIFTQTIFVNYRL
jgi:hypothetical protein